jgi:hypothetical protein
MSEGNCNCCCCCAYLNPPWWVTMGYAPGAGGSRIQNPPATAGFPARPQPPTGAGGGGGTPTVVGEIKGGLGKVAGDVAGGRLDQVPGDIVGTVGNLLHLL